MKALTVALISRVIVLAFMVGSSRIFADLDTSKRLQLRPCDDQISDQAVSAASVDMPLHTEIILKGFGMAITGLPLIALAGLICNVIAFSAAAVVLQRLSLRTLQDTTLANLSVLLFCFNPASVFYSAAYTESLYAATSFLGMYLLPNHFWGGVAAFLAASAARSNGILNCWFLVHRLLCTWHRRGRLPARELAATVAGCLLILGPYTAMQVQAYLAFCRSPAFPAPEWCSRHVPSLYAFIQERYWGVGLLKFYTDPARLPMVALALPVAYLSIRGCALYLAADPLRALTLGVCSSEDSAPAPPLITALADALPAWAWAGAKRRQGSSRGGGAVRRRREGGYLGTAVAPYVFHWAALTAVALLVMNVHVATRFLSVCPALYWFAAHYTSSGDAGDRRRRGSWVWGWAGSYIALGCLLFPNYYPWT